MRHQCPHDYLRGTLMLATIEKSLVALFNPAAPASGPRLLGADGLMLLRRVASEVSLPVVTVATGKLDQQTEPIGKTLIADPFTLFSGELAAPDFVHGQFLYLGGLWLDEDILVAALAAQSAGYDTRVFIDLSIARRRCERSPTLTRLNQHGVLLTTTRQAAYEWAMSGTPGQRQVLRQLVDAAPSG
jgi:hypothetical protein